MLTKINDFGLKSLFPAIALGPTGCVQHPLGCPRDTGLLSWQLGLTCPWWQGAEAKTETSSICPVAIRQHFPSPQSPGPKADGLKLDECQNRSEPVWQTNACGTRRDLGQEARVGPGNLHCSKEHPGTLIQAVLGPQFEKHRCWCHLKLYQERAEGKAMCA